MFPTANEKQCKSACVQDLFEFFFLNIVSNYPPILNVSPTTHQKLFDSSMQDRRLRFIPPPPTPALNPVPREGGLGPDNNTKSVVPILGLL